MSRRRKPARPRLTAAELDARDHDIAVDTVRGRRASPGAPATQERLDAPLTAEEVAVVAEIEQILLKQRDPETGDLPSPILIMTRSRAVISPEEAAAREERIVEALTDLLLAEARRRVAAESAAAPPTTLTNLRR